MGDLEVLGGLVKPGEDPGGARAAGDNPGRLRSEAAFAGCHVSGAPGSRAAAPAAHFLYRLSDSEMTHEPAARTVHAGWAHSCSPCRLDALYRVDGDTPMRSACPKSRTVAQARRRLIR
jgi:hypothetical protein